MGKFIFAAFIVTFGLFLARCDNDSPTESEPPPFTGILRTDANANVLGGDEGDFQPRPRVEPNSRPLNPLNIALHPGFPNPSDEGRIILFYQITEPDSVSIFVFERPNSAPIDTVVNWFHPSRAVYAAILENPGKTGILRVVMETGNGFRTFGDVQFIK